VPWPGISRSVTPARRLVNFHPHRHDLGNTIHHIMRARLMHSFVGSREPGFAEFPSRERRLPLDESHFIAVLARPMATCRH